MKLKSYSVILHEFNDLQDFYNDMETPGGSITIPNRKVDVQLKKPMSRVTVYKLTDEEAQLVMDDPRVAAVVPYNPKPEIELFEYSRSAIQNADHINWGLDVHSEQPISNLPYTGKHVDVIICDDDGWQPDHPEFLDDNGNSRVVEYNWYQHADEVGDEGYLFVPYPPYFIYNRDRTFDYNQDSNGGYHNIHVATTAVGRTNGWAKDANIYFLPLDFGGNSEEYCISSDLCFDYIRAFHRNKPVNPETGRKNPTVVNNSWGISRPWGLFGFNNLWVDTVTYQGQEYSPETETFNIYPGWFGIASDTEMAVSWPSNVDPDGNTVKFKTNNVQTTVEEDRILVWPEEWQKIPNQVLEVSDVLTDSSNHEIRVSTPVDVKNESRIRASSNDPLSYIRVRKYVNNTEVMDQNFYGPEIDINLRGLLRYGYAGPGSTVPVRFIVDAHPYYGDEMQFDVNWNISTHEYNSQTLFDTSDMSDDFIEFGPDDLISPSNTTYSGTAEAITYTPVSLDPIADGFTELDYAQRTSIQFPFDIEFFGQTRNQANWNYKSFLMFDNIGTYTSGGTPSTPKFPKILLGSADNNSFLDGRYMTSIYEKTEGTAPNRTYTLLAQGWESYLAKRFGESFGRDPNFLYTLKFYENEPDRIDITMGEDSPLVKVEGGFTNEELAAFGLSRRGYAVPYDILDIDVIDAIDDGIIMMGAAGNSYSGMFTDDHRNYNNSLNFKNGDIHYIHRGGSPGTAGKTADNAMITVGALSRAQDSGKEQRVDFSNFGPLVDIFAAGNSIQGAWPFKGRSQNITPVEKDGYEYAKISGTSMASPQVCGYLACMLEKYPDMTQKQARELLQTYGIKGEMMDREPDTWLPDGLEEAPNLYLYFPEFRKENTPVYPEINKGRPKTGSVYPRTQIRRRK